MVAAPSTIDDVDVMPLPSNVPLCDYKIGDDRHELSAALDELTLTYCIVDRGPGERTRRLRRHVPSLREARRWACSYRSDRISGLSTEQIAAPKMR
jgi:hypothetical protein